jgi:predicted nucleotidyltransferase
MPVTPYPDVNRMLELLQRRIQEILGANLLGLYVSGSLVTGDFDELVSDIDLVAVTQTALSTVEAERLEAFHRELPRQEKTWEHRVEVAYISAEALRTFRTRPSTIGIVSPGEPFHTKDADKDWLINWYVLRTHGIPLLGPAPAAFVAPISKEELVQWVREHIPSWRGRIDESWRRNSQVYATLTMCRALYLARTGDFVSKRWAATWAIRELPAWAPLIERALRSWREDWYNEQVDHGATRPETIRFVDAVVDLIVGTD